MHQKYHSLFLKISNIENKLTEKEKLLTEYEKTLQDKEAAMNQPEEASFYIFNQANNKQNDRCCQSAK